MRKKGFTLIELLAIIVILAIIALIAVPMITGIIEKSRKSSVELSAKEYIDTVEKRVIISKADVPIEDGTYGIEELTEFGVSVKGNAPIDGTVQIENGKVMNITFSIFSRHNRLTIYSVVSFKHVNDSTC